MYNEMRCMVFMKINEITTILKGIWIGGTMTVPGVSGGSMAMILGIYDKLVSSISSFSKHPKDSFIFLLEFLIGSFIGMILFANPMLKLITLYPMPTLYFFIGAVGGGIPLIFKEAKVTNLTYRTIIYPIIGVALVCLIGLIPSGIFTSTSSNSLSSMLMQIIAGLIISVALVLPGISVSYMLLIIGMYDTVMIAITQLDILSLIPLGIGLAIGILLTTRMLDKAMTNYPQPTYLVIFGFILGSLREIFPGIPSGFELPLCLLTGIAGFLFIYYISKKELSLHKG